MQRRCMHDIVGDAMQLQEPVTANSPASTVLTETMTAKTTDAWQETITEQDATNPTRVKVKIT